MLYPKKNRPGLRRVRGDLICFRAKYCFGSSSCGVDPKLRDRMWFYLAAFENFSELRSGAERTVVPGSALTYEDSRGFIASSKYRFANLQRTAQEVRILACPRSPTIADALGYSSIELALDPKRALVVRADYRGLSGGALQS